MEYSFPGFGIIHKNVGKFHKNVGKFHKNVGKFHKNVGQFPPPDGSVLFHLFPARWH
jgi:hypothetical protein